MKAHDEGIIHFHDADYFAQNALTNCELINLEDMLQNGTIMNGVMIEKPHRFFNSHDNCYTNYIRCYIIYLWWSNSIINTLSTICKKQL